MSKEGKALGLDFFRRPAEQVAPDLLGKNLTRKIRGKTIRIPITEVEIYSGEKDKASHASRGRTERAEVMFWEGGYWYVYLIYGMYEMLNIVVGAKDYPAAILIRGAGEHDGPGKLTRALKIDKKLNAKQVVATSGLCIEESDTNVPKSRIIKTPRIGIAYAGEPWKSKKLRYIAKM